MMTERQADRKKLITITLSYHQVLKTNTLGFLKFILISGSISE